MFENEARELARCLESDQELLQAQAQRLERKLGGGGGDDDEEADDAVQEEEGGPSFSGAVEQLATVRRQLRGGV